ncbi:MAG: PhoH family protein [Clostridia bacterium]|nr:PhoH family protein [Clostridia bacterium]
MAEKTIQFDNYEHVAELFGSFDENIRILEQEYDVTVVSRGGQLKVSGEESAVEQASRAIDGMVLLLEKGETLNEQNIRYVMSMTAEGSGSKLAKLMNDCICITSRGKPVKAKTLGQETYVNAIRDNTVVFGIGPAGTGKTYLAVAMAVKAFKAKEVNRIILTRPAVEAGESLGFLPGDLQQKVDPYLRPLYDALFDMLGPDSFQRQLERGTIEVAPLAYMRGRTLDDSFIILDEAQNTTPEQMKMFLTRLGAGSKAVVTGDITQIDLPGGKRSGLEEVTRILKGIDGIETVTFDARDVVRHHLVQEIVNAYERYNKAQEKKETSRSRKPVNRPDRGKK